MALTVQSIVNAVSTDVRQVLGNSGADATLMIGWVDRVHKDALHTSLYGYLSQGVVQINTAQGESSYTLAVTSMRRILFVFDRTFNRPLLPMEREGWVTANTPTPTPPGAEMSTPPRPQISGLVIRPWPEYYKLIGPLTLHIFPTPTTASAGTLEVHYEQQVDTVANLGDTLLLPEDAKDMLVAGVNALGLQYLKLDQEAQLWMANYERMKRGESVL